MIKIILVGLLSLFFIVNGINHLFNTRVLEEYAEKRSLFSPRFSVIVSGIGMIIAAILLLFPQTKILGAYSLAIFVVLAALLLHRFWLESSPETRMLEFQNFVKNFAIAIEMVYLGTY
ncbi:MAG: DoxX family membrane protein [Saprospiraceae bacterium]|nr:DoxX family membrane protein [Saprospiraceae bacterium]